MKKRLVLWAGAGLLVAAFWAICAFVTFPLTHQRLEAIWLLIDLTLPVAMFRHYPISLYETLAINAVTYGLAGLAVEMLRKQARRRTTRASLA